jgi:hypothetical protein
MIYRLMDWHVLRGNQGLYLVWERLEEMGVVFVMVPFQRGAPAHYQQIEFDLIDSSSVGLEYLAEAVRSSRLLQLCRGYLWCPVMATLVSSVITVAYSLFFGFLFPQLGVAPHQSSLPLVFRGGFQSRSIAPSSY